MQAMATRFANVSTEPHYIVSTFLDPRFKLKWASSRAEECFARSIIVKEVELITILDEQSNQSATTETSEDDLLGFMTSVNNDRIQWCSSELEGYIALMQSAEPLDFWAHEDNKRRFPRLHILIYTCIY